MGVPGQLGQCPAVLLGQRREQPDAHLPQQLPGLGASEHRCNPVQPPRQFPCPGLYLLRHVLKDHTDSNPGPSHQIP